MEKLWGIFDEAGKQIRRCLVLTHFQRAPVGIATRPSGFGTSPIPAVLQIFRKSRLR